MDLTNKQLSRLNNGREYRTMTMEVKDGEEEKMIVEGYATTFNQPYLLYRDKYYEIWEQVSPNAFAECDMTDVIFQYDHEGRVFARNKNNTLWLTSDNIGLLTRASLAGTDIGRQLYQEIKGGYTDKMSFGFIVGADERVVKTEGDKEIITRTITKVSKLYDVSAVSIPANDMTSISARNFSDGVIAEIKAERLERLKKIKKIKIMMEV